MNTASSEPPADYAMSFVKNSPAIYMNGGGPSVSQAYPTMMHPHMQPLYGPPQPQQQPQQQQQNVTEFTNLTPLMNSGMTPQGFSQMHMGMGGGPFGPSSTTGDSSNPSSTSSSRTRLANLGDDSGLSVSSNNGSLLLPGNMGGHGGINMSYGSPQMDLAKMDDDLEPMSRDRCNTWPLRRPTLDINAQTSPLIHDRIPEEDTLYESNENVSSVEASAMAGVTSGANATDGSGSFSSNEYTPTNMNMSSPEGPSDCPMNDGSGGAASKKTTTRRNAWGNMSYADLITQAIMSSPEKRLTLSQVYEWMVQNVPYFRDKGDSNSSAGWKNSIRHNLSLHSRFMRIQNEGAGKSSWWVINPDAKPGRNPRRRAATMEGPTKAALDKKRRGVRKRAEIGSNLSVANSGSLRGPLHSAGSSAIGSTASIVSRDLYNDQDDVLNTNFDAFRSRAQSNISMPPNGSRMSPKVEAFDDFDFPPWADQQQRSSNPEMNDIMGLTDQIRLDNDFNGGSGLAINGMKTDPLPFSEISCPPPGMGAPMTPPNLIRRPQQPPQGYQMGNQQMPHQMRMDMSRGYNAYGPPPPMYGNGMMQQGNGSPMPQQNQHAQHQQQQQQQQWGNPTMDPYSALHGHPCNGGEMMSNGHMLFDQSGPLPLDLENLTLPPNNIMDLDVDSILRHEMAQDGTPLAFDL